MTANMAMIGVLCALQILIGCSNQAPQYQVVVPEGDAVLIALEMINDGEVHFFTYQSEGKNINFFVRTDGTGRLQTHFDACYSCYKYKLGYVREDNQMVCIACRIGYDLDQTVWDYVGACAPILLNSRISGKQLIIRLTRLEKGKKLF
jgi:uncharacterized membrane protein